MDQQLTTDRVAAKQGKSLTCEHLKLQEELALEEKRISLTK